MSGKRRSGRAEALALLGLARRAGAVVRGTDATRRALRDGEVSLVLLADDASRSQLEKVMALLRHGSVPHRTVASQESLGAAVGSGPLSALGVTKRSFADGLLRHLAAAAGEESGRDRNHTR